MGIRFQSATAHVDVELVTVARRPLRQRLQHRGVRVGCIDVGFADATGAVPRRDGRCTVPMKLHGVPAATEVDAAGADVHLPIERAADRAARLTHQRRRQAAPPHAPQTEAMAA